MKTLLSIPRRAAATTPGWLLCALVLGGIPLSGSAAVNEGPAEPKTHTLFMGADVLVEHSDKQFYKVQNVTGGSFIIKVREKEVKVPADWGTVKIKVDSQLKLTGTLVSVDHLTAERVYTPENDPAKRFMKEQGEVLAAGDAVAASAAINARAQVESNAVTHASQGGPQGLPTIYGDPMMTERSFKRASDAGQAASGRDVGTIGKMQDKLAEGLFDAISVEFEISSEKPVAKPYAVIMARFHARDGNPGEAQNWLYAAALDPLDGTPQKVRIRKGGFPPGYVLEKYQLHLYDGGQEIATSAAENRVALTRQEAFAYLLLDYLGSHRGANLPAAPVMGKLSPDEKTQLSPDQLKQTFFVKVSKDGLPLAAYADSSMASPVGGMVAALIDNVRFYPALANGKPADGVAELRFSHLTL